MRRLTSATAGGLTLLVLLGAAPAARGQDEPMPCGVTSDRAVRPSTVVADEKVHVEITIGGGWEGECSSETKGIDIFFVVDRSSTMFDKKYLDPTKAALEDFVNSMDFTKSSAGLITYAANDNINLNLSRNRDSVLGAINRIRLSEEDDTRGLQGAFRVATEKLDNDGQPGNQRIILIVTAGPDKQQQLINMPTVTQAARNAGVLVVFVMFEDSTYTHFVEASSECRADICPTWNLRPVPKRKYAWEVTAGNIGTLMHALVTHLLRSVQISAVKVVESANFGAEFVPGSASPPPSVGPPTYLNLEWEFANGLPPTGLKVSYDVKMTLSGETYETMFSTDLEVYYNDGSFATRPLPNPPVTVLDPRDITATPGPTQPPRPTDTPEPTGVPPTSPPPATPTAGATTEPRIFIPFALKDHSFRTEP
jgi:hypothetical protein